MTQKTKPCIACAEEIKAEALLCKHCKTRQDDPEFLAQKQTEGESSEESRDEPGVFSIDGELFATAAGALRVLDDLDIFTYWKDNEVTDFSASVFNHEDFFLEEDLLKLDALLYALSDKGLVDNEWSPIEEQDDEEEDEQFKWHFELPLIEKLKDIDYVEATLEELKKNLVVERSFEDRANELIVYCLERVKSLTGCEHSFKTTKELDEKCKKCGGVVYLADEYTELFG
jgi:hypothetical protein